MKFFYVHMRKTKNWILKKNLIETKSIKVHINAVTDGKVEPTGKDMWKNKPNFPR